MRSCRDLIDAFSHSMSHLQRIKLLEFVLRAAPVDELVQIASAFANRWRQLGRQPEEILDLLRGVLNEASLSPWTSFAGNLLSFVQALTAIGRITIADRIDFLGYVLRQIGRHLTAYDLITFHHRGANYPDALLLDLVVKEYLLLAAERSDFFLAQATDSHRQSRFKRLRRRGLRQGWILRRFYEGLPVPDVPTSPGEYLRILPSPHRRVPDEQILQTTKRRKRLYHNDSFEQHLQPQAEAVLRFAVHDLLHPQEMRELGTAIFIDRPLGKAKAPGEPDRTLLFAHETFSRSIARRRLDFLSKNLPDSMTYPWDEFHVCLDEQSEMPGLPANLWQNEGHGVVSLADAARASDDFLLLRTMPSSIREFIRQYAIAPLARKLGIDFLVEGNQALIVPEPMSDSPNGLILAIYDGDMNKRLRLAVDLSRGYSVRDGFEFPAAGLQALLVDVSDSRPSV